MIDNKRVEEILNRQYKNQILEKQSPLLINHGMVDTFYPELAEQIITHYKPIKPKITDIIKTLTIDNTKLPVEFYNIQNKQAIHDIHSKEQGQLVEIRGKITKTTTVYQQLKLAAYTCNQCGNITEEICQYNDKIKKTKNWVCNACNRKANHDITISESTFEDVQMITVQEHRDDAIDGQKPVEIQCILTNKDIMKVKSGDEVILNGIVELRNTSDKNMFQEFIIVEHIENENTDYEQITISKEEEICIKQEAKHPDFINRLKRSIAPSIVGCDEIKEGVLLQLMGSDRIRLQGSTKRGDIHILLVGDAGLGKSQILKFVSELAPRGIYTSGKSSSGAGLTATATKDANDVWTLEAGAMVLADKGFLCIDELDKMSSNDRSAMHEALEQQTISIAKAGLTTTLDSRCSVLAAANPKFGSFDQRNSKFSLADQINLPDTLQSRFDLIFIMIDNPMNDEEMIRQMFTDAEDVTFSVDFLRKYVAYAKENIHPDFDEHSKLLVQKYYLQWRRHYYDTNSGTMVTARQLEALMRLARASARARLSEVVVDEDVERAYKLAEYCINQFETQISEEKTEKVGYPENLKDEKTHEVLCTEFVKLSEDFDNKVPTHIFQKHMAELDFSKSFVEKWLRNMDAQEKLIMDVTSNQWSCIGEWYKKFI